MNDKKILILKVLVGSRANGLANEESDYDYRGVYVLPTSKILSLGFNYKGSHWIEGEKEDQTAWEIGHFLKLSLNCNPTVLEVFKSTIQWDLKETKNIGLELIELFPYVWNPHDAFNAFCGYSYNQQKKMLINHLDRWNKYGVAYLRVLWNLCDLLETKTFSLEIKDTAFKIILQQIKNQELKPGQIIDYADQLKKRAEKALSFCNHTPDLEKVNNFLLKVRKEFW